MAITQNTFTGDGSTTNYSFTFEYIKEADVKATLDGTATTAFTLANATTLSFTTAPANGVAIRIFRDTAIDSLKATFFPGSAIKAEDLNDNFTQNNFAVQEADFDVATSNATANTAKTTADTAIATANTASTNATAAVSTANTASTNASAAVSTANTASTNASNAVTTANSAATDAATAISTANTATTTANGAVTTANAATTTANSAVTTANAASTDAATAVSTANTASTNASNAVSTANSANTTAGNAVTTANAATATANSAASDATSAVSTANTASTNASNAVSTANTASTNASNAVSTANTASTNASNAVSTANTASTNATAALNNSRESDGSGGFTSAISKANTAVSTANAASSAVSNAVLFDLIANVSSIPGSPSNNDYIEIGNSTGIESFSPLSGLPSGFVGASGLTVRLRYDSSATSWVFMNYFANDSETRYVAIGNPNPVYYANQAAFPSATTYHGGIAHSHADGAMYYAHGGNWIKMAKENNPTFTGNVGIGTTSPGRNLVVNGGSAEGVLQITNNTSGTSVANGLEILSFTSGEAQFLNRENAGMRFDTNNTERLRIDSSGKVGVGVTNPQTGLHISDGSSLAAPQTTGAGRLTVQNSSSADIQLMSANTGYNHIFFGDQDDANAGVIYYQHSSNVNAMVFTTNAAERLRIDSSGNVGIGTSSPGVLLELKAADPYIRLTDTAGATGYSQVMGTHQGALVLSADTSNSVGSSHLRFDVDATERLRIDSSGNVGIGTASPSKQLEVASANFDTALFKRTNSTGAATIFLSNTSNHGAAIQSLGNGSGGLMFLTQNSNTLAERLRINSSGNVGIGTSSPETKLHINGEVLSGSNPYSSGSYGVKLENLGRISVRRLGATDITFASYPASGSTPNVTIRGNGSAEFADKVESGPYSTSSGARLRSSGAVQVRRDGSGENVFEVYKGGTTSGNIKASIDSDGSADFAGNVGIGTTSPAMPLSVKADGSRNSIQIINAGSGTEEGRLYWYASDASTIRGAISGQENGLVFFAGGATERARIDSSGRLLIGTTSSVGDSFLQIQADAANSLNGASLLLRRGEHDGHIAAGEALGQISFTDNGGEIFGTIKCEADANAGTNDHPGRIQFSTTADGASSPTERMRITAEGIGYHISTNHGYHLGTTVGAGTSKFLYRGHHSSTAGTYNSGTECFTVWSNGNVINTNNSYGQISDVKLKENIADANSQWNDIKAVQVRNFNFKEETGNPTHTQIGVIAQEIETVSPGLVTQTPDYDDEGNDLGTVTKGVNYSVLYMKSVKALQEAIERIETLEAKVAALEAE